MTKKMTKNKNKRQGNMVMAIGKANDKENVKKQKTKDKKTKTTW